MADIRPKGVKSDLSTSSLGTVYTRRVIYRLRIRCGLIQSEEPSVVYVLSAIWLCPVLVGKQPAVPDFGRCP